MIVAYRVHARFHIIYQGNTDFKFILTVIYENKWRNSIYKMYVIHLVIYARFYKNISLLKLLQFIMR